MTQLVATSFILFSCLICSVYSQDCDQDGDWPRTPSGLDAILFCNPLHKALPFQEFERIFRTSIPPLLRDAIQYELDVILRERKCTNGTWESVVSNCPTPAGCWQKNLNDFHCNRGYEMSGFLCYPECKPEYYGVGPVCWKPCPANTSDKGVVCVPESVVVPSTKQNCHVLDPCGIAQKCTSCPEGYTNMGCFCTKDYPVIMKESYGRPGVLPQYPPCPNGLTSCGILCANSTTTCSNVAMVIANDLLQAIAIRAKPLRWISVLGPSPVSPSSLAVLVQLFLSPKCSS